MAELVTYDINYSFTICKNSYRLVMSFTFLHFTFLIRQENYNPIYYFQRKIIRLM